MTRLLLKSTEAPLNAIPKMFEQSPPILSMAVIAMPDGGFAVQLIVSGLSTESQAVEAMLQMQGLLCGPEMSETRH